MQVYVGNRVSRMSKVLNSDYVHNAPNVFVTPFLKKSVKVSFFISLLRNNYKSKQKYPYKDMHPCAGIYIMQYYR